MESGIPTRNFKTSMDTDLSVQVMSGKTRKFARILKNADDQNRYLMNFSIQWHRK